jgi:O-antigen/teichoic acid export membrane protein
MLAFLPRVSRAYARRRLETVDLFRLATAGLGISLPLASGLFLAMPFLVHALYGQPYMGAVGVARVAVWLLPFAALSNVLITNTALVMGRPGIALWATSAGIASTLIGLVIFHSSASARMAAVAVVVGEAVAALVAFVLCRAAILAAGLRTTGEGTHAECKSTPTSRRWSWDVVG